MTVSMTGFATRRGQVEGWSWLWEIRSVNGKGLDLRLRLPDWIEGLEPAIRSEMTRILGRGNVTLALKLTRETGQEGAIRVNIPALRGVLTALARIEREAQEAGVTLRPASQAELLALRGVQESGTSEEDSTDLRAALLADLPFLLTDFCATRAAEGAALNKVITGQLDEAAMLLSNAAAAAEARRDTIAKALRDNIARVLEQTDATDEARLAQELALIAVKTDVTEEIDRLGAHIEAARKLLAAKGPVGRKFDFLMQEFMRETNTICSKAQSLELTRTGLDLKTVIDQMREQVQNVE
ncbi:MAG: YicC/YloC family endoribonuclease [Pseudorhodobacter sp.]